MKSLETCVGENLPFILRPVHAAQSVGLPLPTSASMFCSIADSVVVFLPDRNRTRAPFPLILPSECATTLDLFLTHFPLPMIALSAPLFISVGYGTLAACGVLFSEGFFLLLPQLLGLVKTHEGLLINEV